MAWESRASDGGLVNRDIGMLLGGMVRFVAVAVAASARAQVLL